LTHVDPDDPPINIIATDEDITSLRSVQDALGHGTLNIRIRWVRMEQLDRVVRERPEIVLLDWIPPVSHSLARLHRIVAALPETAIIVLANSSALSSAAEAIRHGATDVLSKPVAAAALRERIYQIVNMARKSRCSEVLGDIPEGSSFQGIIGRSPRMLEVFARIRQIAPHFRTVLLTGETGTGKELAARALHELNPARGGPFVACNCSAVVETLFESELFGYAQGAFTGARQDKQGLLEYAHGGTLLLDEIGDMPLGLQSKLLRVLQNQEFQRVGSPVPRKVDIRVVAATNQDLREMAARREFRQDLFYRLAMVEIRLPSLVERREDLPLLERHFLRRFRDEFRKPVHGLTRRAEAFLAAYCWPGNVRELENTLGYACMMSAGETIDLDDLPPHLFEQGAVSQRRREPILPLDEFERSYVRRVLVSLDGNKVRTAEALGISRSKLYSLLVGDHRARKR
jgi:DNA-binding NtrC family response regulator